MTDDFIFYALGTSFVLTFVILFGLYMAGLGKFKSFIGAILFGTSIAYGVMNILIIKAGGV